MSRSGGKRRAWDDWAYFVVMRDAGSIPLLTTRSGVVQILTHNGINRNRADELVGAIDKGKHYISSTGYFKRVYRRLRSTMDELRYVTVGIKHSGEYGICWWNKAKGAVWWVQAVRDIDEALVASGQYTSPTEIKERFTAVRQVKSVRIEVEKQPNPRRGEWIEIRPAE